MYSSPSLASCAGAGGSLALDYQNSPYCQGMRLLDQGAVTGVLQVGESIRDQSPAESIGVPHSIRDQSPSVH